MGRRATLNRIMKKYDLGLEEADGVLETIVDQAREELALAIRANKDETIHQMKHKLRGYLEYVCHEEIDQLIWAVERGQQPVLIKAGMRRILELLENDIVR